MNCSFCGKDNSPLFDTQSTFTGADKVCTPRYTCLDCIDMEMSYLESIINDKLVLTKHSVRVLTFILENK
jgi:hypothetical protein